MTKKPAVTPDIVKAARDLRKAMQQAETDINRVAQAAGIFMACRDNEAGTETLSSVEADQAYQLVGNLTRAYMQLADFLAKL